MTDEHERPDWCVTRGGGKRARQRQGMRRGLCYKCMLRGSEEHWALAQYGARPISKSGETCRAEPLDADRESGPGARAAETRHDTSCIRPCLLGAVSPPVDPCSTARPLDRERCPLTADTCKRSRSPAPPPAGCCIGRLGTATAPDDMTSTFQDDLFPVVHSSACPDVRLQVQHFALEVRRPVPQAISSELTHREYTLITRSRDDSGACITSNRITSAQARIEPVLTSSPRLTRQLARCPGTPRRP